MNRKVGIILINWLPLIAYCIFIFFLSSISTPKLMSSVDYSDKILHFGAFVVLAILFWRAFRSLHMDIKKRVLIFLTFFSSTVFGVLIEINQSLLVHRHAELMDVGADVIGAIVGIISCLWYFNRKAVSDSAG